MDADEVLTGKKKKEHTTKDVLFSAIGKPVQEDMIKEVFQKKSFLPDLNPKPFVKIVELKGKDRKVHQGLEVGLKFSF